MSVHDGARLGPAMFGEQLDPRDYLLRFFPDAPVPPLDHIVRTAEPLVARINQGTWIASCPCGARGIPSPGAVVFLDWPFVWCVRCSNGGTGRGWRPVLVPPPDERRAIEAVLNCRPNPQHRNWENGESVADLISQNREHGDPVPNADDPPAAALSLVPTGPRWPSDAARAVLRQGRSSLRRLVRR